MDLHQRLLDTKCRICASNIKKDKKTRNTFEFATKISQIWAVNINLDSPFVHPSKICHKCHVKAINKEYQERKHSVSSSYVFWTPHSVSCLLCSSAGKAGRKRRKRRRTEKSEQVVNDSDTDTAGEEEEIELEHSQVYSLYMADLKNCLCKIPEGDKAEIFKDLLFSQTPDVILEGLTGEKKEVIFKKLCQERDVAVLNPSDLDKSVTQIPSDLLCNTVKEIFKQQRQKIKEDVASFSQCYRDVESLKNMDCSHWLQLRNPIVVAAIHGLNSDTPSEFLNCLLLEHLYNICGINAVLPFSFLSNLFIFAISNSKLAVTIVSKTLPGGSYTTLRSWLDQLSSTPHPFPVGDCAVAIDNDQVVKKNWKVRVGQKCRVSIVTSVCQAEIDPKGQLQKQAHLSPRSWRQPLSVNHLPDLEKAIAYGADEQDVLRKQNKRFLQGCLEKVVAQQRKIEDGTFIDDIDSKIVEIQKKKTTRICPNCKTEMEKKKRKCVNPDCRVDLKAAEQQLTGEDILGTALLTPLREFNYRHRENEVVIEVDEDDEEDSISQKVITRFEQFNIEWPEVKSGHPPHPITISVSDPVFVNPASVNPASVKAVAEVLRHVGMVARVSRYGFSEREWLPVTMDGSPYSIAVKLIESTHICLECSRSHKEVEPCNSYLPQDWDRHVKSVHGGGDVDSVLEFNWVVLRIGPLHVEMNMVKTLFAINWDVCMSSLARELGFSSEPALKYAKSASNHHHAQTMIKTMLEGSWCELLLPYVRERLQQGKKVSLNDYIYQWAVGVKNDNYRFQFEMLWRYAGGFQIYHIGIRRNNPEYVRVGLLAFAPLFSWHPFTSKYQLIELQDRCLRTLAPQDLREYLESTESVSSSGNPSKGEGLDAQLEEVNKTSKVWEHGAMTAKEWLTIFRNHDELNELRERTFTLFGMSDPKADDIHSRARYRLDNEILAWRVKLRQERSTT